MKREDILKLIEEKEAKDLETKARISRREKRTEEVFHIIKQDVMDRIVKQCIDTNYFITSDDIETIVYQSLIESGEFVLNNYNCKIEGVFCNQYLIGSTTDAKEFLSSIDAISLIKNTKILMESHGFKPEYHTIHLLYVTTKENLLSFSEIISKDISKEKKRFVQAPPIVRYDTEDDGYEVIKGLELLTGVVILFILLTSVYIFS